MINIKNFSHLNNETSNLNDNFFSIKKKTKSRKRILVISGGSRNGNHLVTSILDGHPQLPFLPGEDRALSEIFWNFFKNKKKFLKDLKNKENYKLISKLSGVKFDKWKKISEKKFSQKHKNQWAGNHPQGFVPLLEYPNQNYFSFNHEAYLKALKLNFKDKILTFEDFFINYLDAFSKLVKRRNSDLKYDYIYANSGLRRELYYLCKKRYDVKCIVPIRKFETFYFSKIYARFKTVAIKHKYINYAWPHWKNKTIDYLILKKMFPKQIVLVKFEDLIKKDNANILKKICDFLKIKFDKSLNLKTFNGFNVKPNSSFKNKKIKKKNRFPKEYMPIDYKKIYQLVEKMSLK